MAKSRKTKGRQAVRHNHGQPAWLLVLLGIILGAAAMAWISFSGLLPISRVDEGDTAQPEVEEPAAEAPAQKVEERPKAKYDFYSVLPEKEVVIPDAEISAVAADEKSAEAKASKSKDDTEEVAAIDSTTKKDEDTRPTPTTDDKPKASDTTNDSASAPAQSGYLLQVASVTDESDADGLKAKLALQGLVARVESVTIDGTKWYRVRLGPFSRASDLEATKKQLKAAGIDAIALKATN